MHMALKAGRTTVRARGRGARRSEAGEVLWKRGRWHDRGGNEGGDKGRRRVWGGRVAKAEVSDRKEINKERNKNIKKEYNYGHFTLFTYHEKLF
jgi:hypothetical protein